MKKSFLPEQAFKTLKQAEITYKQENSFPNGTLETIHSFFGNSFIQASELLEKCKIVQYSTSDMLRKIYKVSSSRDQYTLFEDINFCQCAFFKIKVLEERNSLTCKHVLAVHVGKIMGKISEETLSDNVYEDFLNEQCKFLLDLDTQDMN